MFRKGEVFEKRPADDGDLIWIKVKNGNLWHLVSTSERPNHWCRYILNKMFLLLRLDRSFEGGQDCGSLDHYQWNVDGSGSTCRRRLMPAQLQVETEDCYDRNYRVGSRGSQRLSARSGRGSSISSGEERSFWDLGHLWIGLRKLFTTWWRILWQLFTTVVCRGWICKREIQRSQYWWRAQYVHLPCRPVLGNQPQVIQHLPQFYPHTLFVGGQWNRG